MTTVPSGGGHDTNGLHRRRRHPHRPPPAGRFPPADPAADPAFQDDRPRLVPFQALVTLEQPRPRVHTTMIAVDICGFGDPSRDDVTQLHLRRQMYEQFAEACGNAQLPWEYCYREDRGDGVLVITPSDVPIESLLDSFGGHFGAAVRTYNRHASQAARLQLRVALHTGLVNRDAYGVTGQALVHLFRLLEADAFKNALAESGTDLGMIVSDRLYCDALSQGGLTSRGAYRKLQITCKETRMDAWVRFPA